MSQTRTRAAGEEPGRLGTRPGRRATLHDIAEILGVSEATVSRALRNDPQIGRRTREAVSLVAAELEYVPNHAARSLAKSATMTFGLMVPDVVDQLHGLVVKGFQDVALARDRAAIVISAFRDVNQEARVFQVFRSFQVDAVALYGAVTDPRVAAAAVGSVPTVFVGPESVRPTVTKGHPAPTVIQIENEDGMAQIVDHVLGTGRARLSYVNGPDVWTNRVRRQAVAAALEQAGQEPRLREYPGLASREDYAEVISTIVRESPDVLVCYDDTTALNLIALLRQRGVRVPADIAVTGFDDIPYAQISNPSLTTVTQPAEYLGRQAATILLDMLDGGPSGVSEDVPLSLVVRESTGGTVG